MSTQARSYKLRELLQGVFLPRTTTRLPYTPRTLIPRLAMSNFSPQSKKRRVSLDLENHAQLLAPEPSARGLLVKRHSEKAKAPTRGSALAAGYDLYSAQDKLVPAHGKALIDTQISIAVPDGTYGRIAPRSGLASKFMIDTGAGVVDADYRGIVFVLLFNLSDKDFEIKEGDRIAQLILEKIYTPEVQEVENLDETIRGVKGFGSTGGHRQLQVPA